ncbi:MAG: cytochrome c [Hyphomonadaceae bacterium]
MTRRLRAGIDGVLSASTICFALAACTLAPAPKTDPPPPAVAEAPEPDASQPDALAGSPEIAQAAAREISPEEIRTTGEQLYQARCATCHETGRAPSRRQIAANTPEEILEALDTGFMAAVALFLTPEQKTILASHLSETDEP